MKLFRTLLGAAAVVLSAGSGLAEKITLHSDDGGLTLSGEPLGFDGTYLRLRTADGVLTVKMEGMACTGAACPDRSGFVPEIVLAGSADMATVLLPPLIESYARENGSSVSRDERGDALTYVFERAGLRHLRIALRPMTTQEGFEALLTEEADLVLASRPPLSAEVAAIEEAGHGDLSEVGRFRTLAWGGVVPIVSPALGVTTLDFRQLGAIRAGEVTSWEEVSGVGGGIDVHVAGSATGPMQFADLLLRSVTGEANSVSVERHQAAGDAVSAVVAAPGALGLVSWSEAGAAQALEIGGECGLSVPAAPAALRSGDYPLAVPYRLYLPQRRLAPDAAAFVDWLDSRAAERVVRRAGFADAGRDVVPMAQQGERLALAMREISGPDEIRLLQELLTQLDGAARMTPTFRFETGSADIGSAGREIASRLARAIDGGEITQARVLFVGFHDGREAAEDRDRLAAARAEAALIRVARAMDGAVPENVALEIASGGDALSVACPEAAWGRRLNRRVEVWLAPLE
ncbi:substrate-binding domain-containing protein [Aestuariibius sp. 2305UL40-4]|uniref:substrate-binding domain-containing protein n=1 Tax=Aestuariibius violaceus TaxID=3234132 RepID=UPI00345E8771